MNIYRSIKETHQAISEIRQKGQSIGFVPTMGYLHEGHLSLVKAARKENDIVAASVFVNPTQFGPNEDFEQYPRDEERDFALLREEGTDLVFVPPVEEMYPQGFSTYVQPPKQSQGWEGATRPTHFRGVCTVVSMLFNIAQPRHAYFGRKDAQQAAVIRQMVHDLHFPIEIVACPIVREEDGLAMSSRNIYLSPEERQRALALNQILLRGVEKFRQGERDSQDLLDEAAAEINEVEGVKLDYFGIVDQNTFQSVDHVHEGDLFIGAMFVGKTRLIDNREFVQG